MESVGAASLLERRELHPSQKPLRTRQERYGLSQPQGAGERLQNRWKICIIVYFMGFIDLFGVSMIITLLPKMMHNLGMGRSVAGLIGSLYGAIQIFSSPIIGRMSDVYGRKRLLLLCYFGSSLGYFSLSCSGSIIALIIFRIPIGILKHGLSIEKAYLADITIAEERAGTLGYFNAISSVGFIIGPLLSGYLADIDPSLRLSFLTGSMIYTINFFCVLLFFPSSQNISIGMAQKSNASLNGHKHHTGRKELTFKGLQKRGMKQIIAIRFLTILSVLIFRYNFSVFMEETFATSNTMLGQITSFKSTVSVIASATCGYMAVYYNHSRCIVYFVALLVISLLLTTLTFNFYVVLVCLVLLSFSTSNIRVSMLSIFLQIGGEKDRGAIVGISDSISSFCRMLAPSLVGVAQEYGSRLCVGFATALALLALVGMILCPVYSDDSDSDGDDDGKKSHTD